MPGAAVRRGRGGRRLVLHPDGLQRADPGGSQRIAPRHPRPLHPRQTPELRPVPLGAGGDRDQQAGAESGPARPKVAALPIIKAQPEPVEWLRGRLGVGFSVPTLMSISMAGPDPESITLILNAVRDAFVKEVATRDQKDRAERIEELK